MVRNLLTLAAVTVVMTACHVGMTVKKYPPAQSPKGVSMRVNTAQGPLVGELIEVRDSGIVLADQKLHLLLFRDIVSSEVDKTSSHYTIANRTAPAPDVRERLRLLSRFPYGLTPELMERLLRAYGQTELTEAPLEKP